MNKKILDPCCGSKMFWFQKKHPSVVYGDIRSEEHILCDGRKLVIDPEVKMDFRAIPYLDNFFKLIVFDPPHLINLGKSSWMAKKYGVLSKDWREDIKRGFSECWRVLDHEGTFIFKRNENQIKIKEILGLIDQKPLFGHTSGKNNHTIRMVFFKE